MDISVIIISQNSGDIVTHCLNHLLQQQGIEFEVIVVDNSSTDESLELLQTYSKRIRLMAYEHSTHLALARNQAVEYANGKLLYFLHPNSLLTDVLTLKKIYDFAEANPTMTALTTDIIPSALTEKTESIYYHYPYQEILKLPLKNLSGDIAYFCEKSFIISKACFLKNRGFDMNFKNHYGLMELCLRLRSLGDQLGYCDDIKVEYKGLSYIHDVPTLENFSEKFINLQRFFIKHYSTADVNRVIKKQKRKASRQLALLRLKQLIIKNKNNSELLLKNLTLKQCCQEYLQR